MTSAFRPGSAWKKWYDMILHDKVYFVHLQHLQQQQQGIQHLISIIKTDLDDLQLIEQGLVDTTTVRRT